MRAFLLILLPALLLAACGQKGALYLPAQAPARHHPALSSSNATPQPLAASAATTGTP